MFGKMIRDYPSLCYLVTVRLEYSEGYLVYRFEYIKTLMILKNIL